MKIRLAGLRVNAGFSQEQVSKMLNVSKSTIGKWEKYETFPDAPQLKELCNLYGCSLDDVYIPDKRLKEVGAAEV